MDCVLVSVLSRFSLGPKFNSGDSLMCSSADAAEQPHITRGLWSQAVYTFEDVPFLRT
jgi:hypothetical protein